MKKLKLFILLAVIALFIIPSYSFAAAPDYALSGGVLTIYNDTGMAAFTGSSTTDPVTRSSVTSIVISSGVTYIGDYAFPNYTNVTSVTIPNTVTSIGAHAFYYCTGLTSLNLPGSVTTIGTYAFYWCTGLTTLTIPEGVVTLDNYAFRCFHNVTTVSLPSTLTTIGSNALAHSYYLTSITIPSNVTSIGSAGIGVNTALTTVTFESVTPPSGGDAIFSGDSSLATIYVPSSSLTAYKSAFPGYASIIVGSVTTTTVSDNDSSSSTTVSDNDSSSSTTVSDNDSGAFHWEPTTTKDIFAFSKRSSESVTFKSVKTDDGDLTIVNDTQGELFMDSVNSILEDFTIGYTYNAYINSHIQRNFGGNYTIVMDIPESLRADSRVFKIIAVDEKGVPISYADEDLSNDTITFTSPGMYAFALCYK